jgi:elongation factor Ts
MSISAKDVMKLREMTGAGMMDCKEALTDTAGDFEQAVDFLRKKGLSKAAKKADRTTNEGLVHAIVAADNKSGAMLEFNCETDFVARNEEFVRIVEALTKQAAAAAGVDVSAEWLAGQPYGLDPSSTVQSAVAGAIAKLGENMKLARAVRYQRDGNGVVYAYIHPGSRTGVLIDVATGNAATASDAAFLQVVRELSMQVAAMNPKSVRREDADVSIIEKEKEIFRAQLVESGKPPQVIDKIVDGKMEKFFSETCLLEQSFIKDQDRKVQDVVAAAGKSLGDTVTVVRFTRFGLGETA